MSPIKLALSKISASIILISSLSTVNAQTVVFASHFNDVPAGSITKCEEQCPTYDKLCVQAGCNSPYPSFYLWRRIGTPNYPSAGFVSCLSSDGMVEGIFAPFDFLPGENYTIHVGVNSFSNTISAGSGSIKVLATTKLQETRSDNVCCFEKSPIDYGSSPSIFRNLSHPFDDYWANNNSQNSISVDGMEIESFAPGTAWGGSTINFSTSFQPPVGSAFKQITIHPYSDVGAAGQLSATFDYVVIERDCPAGFGYTLSSKSTNTVTFKATNPSSTVNYNWNFGDGTIIPNGGSSIGHAYSGWMPSPAVVTACLSTTDDQGDQCDRCIEVCLPTVHRPGGGCELDNDFNIEVLNPFTGNVILSPTSPSSTSYDVSWGDGTYTNGATTAITHKYALPGTYEVCFTKQCQEGPAQITCMSFCLPAVNSFDATDVSEYSGEITSNEEGRKMMDTDDELFSGSHIKNMNSLIDPSNLGIGNIQFTSEAVAEAHIVIYDMLGKVIWRQKTIANKGANNIKVDIQNFASGTYVVEVIANGEVSRKRMVKN